MFWVLPIIILLLALLLPLLIPIHIEITTMLRKSYINTNIMLLIAGAFPIRLRLLTSYEPKRGIVVRLFSPKGMKIVKVSGEPNNEKRKRLGRVFIHAAKKTLNTKSIELSGELGCKDNPALCVFMAGAVRILLNNAVSVLGSCFLGEDFKTAVAIFPNLEDNVFCLNLEGIFCLIPAKLLSEALSFSYKYDKKQGGR